MKSLADLHLARLLRGSNDGAALRRQLKVLVAAGVLDAGEAERWRERFSALESGVETTSPYVRKRALDHLRATGSLHLLVSYKRLGLLSHEQMKAELVRLRPEPDQHFDVPSAGEAGEQVGPFMRAIAGPADRVGGLRITTVELFAKAIAFNWHFDPGFAHGPDGALVRRLIASERFWVDGPEEPLIDGPDYVPLDEDATPTGGGEWIGSHLFAPGVPPSPTRLDIMIAGRTLTVSLR